MVLGKQRWAAAQRAGTVLLKAFDAGGLSSSSRTTRARKATEIRCPPRKGEA